MKFMDAINITNTGAISGNNVQIGGTNNLSIGKPLGSYENELLNLFNEHCPTEIDKKQLIEDLHNINDNGPEKTESAKNILSFIISVGSGLVSSAIYPILHYLATTGKPI